MEGAIVIALALLALAGLMVAIAPVLLLRLARIPDEPSSDTLLRYRLGGIAVMLIASAAEFAFLLYQLAENYTE